MNQWISDRDHGEKEKKRFVGTECRRAENVDLKCLGSPHHKNRGLENLFWARTRNLCQGVGSILHPRLEKKSTLPLYKLLSWYDFSPQTLKVKLDISIHKTLETVQITSLL